MKLRKVWIIFASIVFILLAVIVAVLSQVDDWSRDFHTNHAETADDAPNENLQPIHANLPPNELADLVVQAVEGLPQWQFIDKQSDKRQEVIAFTRATRWLRFQDDISVRTLQRLRAARCMPRAVHGLAKAISVKIRGILSSC